MPNMWISRSAMLLAAAKSSLAGLIGLALDYLLAMPERSACPYFGSP